jgi:hypothetical protein
VGQDEGGFLGLLDDVGDGEGFAGAGRAEQGLEAVAGPLRVDGVGLVAGGLKADTSSNFMETSEGFSMASGWSPVGWKSEG